MVFKWAELVAEKALLERLIDWAVNFIILQQTRHTINSNCVNDLVPKINIFFKIIITTVLWCFIKPSWNNYSKHFNKTFR